MCVAVYGCVVTRQGGAIMADGTLFLSGSLIMGAEAEVGGAIFMWDGDGTVSGTTFVCVA